MTKQEIIKLADEIEDFTASKIDIDTFDQNFGKVAELLFKRHSQPELEFNDDIKTLKRKNKKLQKRIDHLESDSMKSLCNVTATNKKLFRIALRRYDNRFESTSQFIKWCIKQVTGKTFKEFCEMGK